MKKILFVRHAESVLNAEDFPETEGSKNDQLTQKGKQQAIHFAQNHKEVPELIVSSPYNRSKETAHPLRDKFSNTKYEVWDDVREFSYLEDGLSENQKRIRRKEFWSKKDPMFRDHKNTESFSELVLRVDTVLDKLSEIKECSVVVFSHAKFMRVLIRRIIHFKTVHYVHLMEALLSYKHRFDFCDTLELSIDDSGVLYLKDIKEDVF